MKRILRLVSLKDIIHVVSIFLLLMSWQSVGYSEEISEPVTYRAEHKPLGDGIDWETSIPADFDPLFLQFKFKVNPGTLTSEIHGNIIFDQDNQTLSVKPRIVTDLKENFFAGKLENSAGVLLSGEIVYNFEIPIPIFPDITISGTALIPGFPHVDVGWQDEAFFNTFLFGIDETVEVKGGVRKLISAEITAVEIAELLAIALSQGALPQKIADKAGKIIKEYIGDGGIRVNGGLENRFVFSGLGIYVNGQLITREDQTVSASGINPVLNSYSIHSSFEETLLVALDFILSSDVFFNFAPFNIELWSYEKEIAAVPIPLVPDTPIDAFDFITTPDPITFPLEPEEVADPNQSPVTIGSIANQTLQVGGSSTSIDISGKFNDPDNDTLTYNSTSSNSAVATAQIVGSQMTIYSWSSGSATITVTAIDPDGLAATQTLTVTVPPSTTTVNRAPVAEGTISSQSLYVGGVSTTIDISNKFRDPDSDSLTYTATSNNTRVISVEVLNNNSIRITPEANGSATVTVTASDGNLSATQTFSVTVSTLLVRPNRPPTTQGTISSQSLTVGGTSTTIDVSSYFSDSDGDSLTYTVTSSDDDVVSVYRTGSSSIRLTPEGDGNATVTVTASDGRLSGTQTFSVVVNPSDVDSSDVPDIVVENISADFVENYPGERFTVSATVRNAGERRAPNVRVRYYLSDDATYSTDDEEYEKLDDGLGSMDSSETSRPSVNLDAPDEQGTYYIIVRVARVSNELNTDNNYASIKITVLPPATPDLVISLTAWGRKITLASNNTYLIDPNDYFKLNATVRNQGKEDAPSTTIHYYFSTDTTISDDDEEIDTDTTINRLRKGRSSDERSDGLRSPLKPGDYYYYACVDSVDSEGNTDNNCSNVITVSVRGPDYVIDSVRIDYFHSTRTTVNPNGIFRLYTNVRNQGTDDGELTTIRYYLSSDRILSFDLSSDDVEVDSDTIYSLDIGEIDEDRSETIHIPYTSGVFYCFVCVDEIEDEIDTDNNCSDPIKLAVRNISPRVVGTIPTQTLNVGTPKSIGVASYFTDVNRDTLTYTVNSNDNNIATAVAVGAQLTITPKRAGNATITVTASDSEFTATQTITISVISEETWMPDVNLRAGIRSIIGLQQDESLTQQVLQGVTSLKIDQRNIKNLTGLEHATELTDLNIGRNQISDITPLEGLTKLTNLDLKYNQVLNLTPLQNLSNLTVLNLHQNVGVNIISLKGLTKLTHLDLGRNGIRNFTPLHNLTNLTHLNLSFNSINDIAFLQNFTSLIQLNLWYTQNIVDITPLQNLTTLTYLHLGTNKIVDITPLKDLTALTNLNLTDNQIKNVAVLEDLIALKFLYLKYNPITDFEPIRRLIAKNVDMLIDIDIPEVSNNAPVVVGTISARTLTVGDSAIVIDVSENFNDTDNDDLTYSASSNDDNVATASASGSTVTITPVGTGNATISVTASDGKFFATQTISVSVVDPNRTPVAVGTISARTLTVGDESIQIDISSNFSDPDGDTLTYTANSNNDSVATASASGSTVTITPVGTGSATITVTASDGALTTTQTISVTITAAVVANRAPFTVGAISPQTLTEGDSAIQIDVSSNFSDPDGDTLTYSANSDNSGVATVSVSGSQITITPIAAGSATITVTASDGALTATQTIAVTVSAVPVSNRAPVTVSAISSQSLTVGNSAIVINVSGNFSDPDNDTLTYSAYSDNTTAATVSISGSQVTITPVAAGSATITVTASDGTLTTTQTITVSVIPAIAEDTWMPDANLRSVVRKELGITEGNVLTQEAMKRLQSISAQNSQITNIAGLEYAFNLTNVWLGGNQISDVSPFQNLTGLKNMFIDSNQLSDITPLRNLTSLTVLYLRNNQITDISPLENLQALTILLLDGNPISDTTPLVRLKLRNPNISIDIDVNTGTTNNSPTAVGNIPAQTLTLGGSEVVIDVSGYFQDEDGDSLEYSANSSNTNVVDATVSGSEVTLIPVGVGSTIITVEASDDELIATQIITVSVPVISTTSEEDWMPDANLRAAVRSSLGLQESDALTQSTMTGLTLLVAGRSSINDLTGLEHATNLTNLTIFENQISVITALGNLTSLTYLHLSQNQISNITPLENLTNLTSLYLGSNQIRDISSLANLTNLTTLSLSNNHISDVTPLANLTNLTTLWLTSNTIGDLAPLRRLKDQNPNVQIDIDIPPGVPSNNWMPDENLRAKVRSRIGLASDGIITYEALQQLTWLNANDAQITDITGLEYATGLRNLSLTGNQISNLTPLQDLTSLQELRLWNNQISDITPLSGLNVYHLGLSENQISNLTPLANLTSLTLLSLSDNAISDITPLRNLTRLWHLNLSENQITNITTLSNLTRFSTVETGKNKALYLSDNQISDITTLANLTALRVLDLSNNQISSVTSLENLNELVDLFLTGNSITDDSPLRRLQANNQIVRIDIVNRAPFTVGTIPDRTFETNDNAATIQISRYFNDRDRNTVLVYNASSNNTNVAAVSSSGSTITITPGNVGRATITVTASDGELTATQNFTVTVTVEEDEEGEDDWMPDENLRTLVKRRLGLGTDEDLTQQVMPNLTGLNDHDRRGGGMITELTGLEYATGLTSISLSDRQHDISDLSPLSELTSLTYLQIRGTVSDLTPLASLTSLTALFLSNNQISDISPLANLTSLDRLFLGGNQISDITPLASLTSLPELCMSDNQISDITPLANLTSLTAQLCLENNQISDVTPLANLTVLKLLFISGNPISDYAPLRRLKTANPNVSISIDLTNNIPTFTEGASTTRSIAENIASGVNIGTAVSATDGDTDDTLTYSLSGTDAKSFSIVSTSGQLQTSAALDYETKTSYSIIVTVYDGNSGGDTITVTINVTDDVNGAPSAQTALTKTALLPNYPNPFNPETWIPYQLAKPANVTLTIYNVRGVKVRQLALGHRSAGIYYSRSRAAHWDGKNNLGEKVATGLYFVKFSAGDYTTTRKMLIRK